ncbi:MAG: type IV pili twitching motility protein PilT, partial [Oscillospiraceae bacterium]
DRILDAFPPDQRHQVATQLSMILEAVVSQQLLPAKDGTVVLATELMMMNSAIRNIIRENKIHQLDNVIYSAQDSDMISMDTSILKLYKDGKITEKTAVQ